VPDAALRALALLLVLAALAGAVPPAIPGAPLVPGGLFLGAWIGDFTKVGLSLAMVGVFAVAWLL
jgi:uncharacterized protein